MFHFSMTRRPTDIVEVIDTGRPKFPIAVTIDDLAGNTVTIQMTDEDRAELARKLAAHGGDHDRPSE